MAVGSILSAAAGLALSLAAMAAFGRWAGVVVGSGVLIALAVTLGWCADRMSWLRVPVAPEASAPRIEEPPMPP